MQKNTFRSKKQEDLLSNLLVFVALQKISLDLLEKEYHELKHKVDVLEVMINERCD